MNLPSLPPLPAPAVDGGVNAIFAVVYLGMFLGGLPRLKRRHAAIGVPVTAGTLAIVRGWRQFAL